jgi:four helix bundle protein
VATIQRFIDLEAWQKARELTKQMYSITNPAPFSKDFELRGQIRSASVSAMSNIAEGFERNGTAEFVQFLSIAKGSVAEVAAQLFVAVDQRYVTSEEFDRLSALAIETNRKIGGLMSYLRRSGMKGLKFR